jgi:hypothetical protein
MARTQNVQTKTAKEAASMDADIANKYADVHSKIEETRIKEREANIKAAQAVAEVSEQKEPTVKDEK